MNDELPGDGTWLDYTTTTLFTIKQLAAAEGVSTRTIERLLGDARAPFGDGDGGPYPIGKEVRIPRQAVIHFHRWARAQRSFRRTDEHSNKVENPSA